MFCEKFQNIGVQKQYDSTSKAEANKKYEISCELCSQRGLHIQCNQCAIKTAHDLIITLLDK